MNEAWKKADYSQYDMVFYDAGIAHVNADPKMEPRYASSRLFWRYEAPDFVYTPQM